MDILYFMVSHEIYPVPHLIGLLICIPVFISNYVYPNTRVVMCGRVFASTLGLMYIHYLLSEIFQSQSILMAVEVLVSIYIVIYVYLLREYFETRPINFPCIRRSKDEKVHRTDR